MDKEKFKMGKFKHWHQFRYRCFFVKLIKTPLDSKAKPKLLT